MVGQPRRNFMKMASWSSVSEHLVNPIGMSDQLKWNNHKDYPRFGPVWYLENNINSGFRFLTCDNYIIFYQITKETILIVRILHRLQDYVKQLF